MSVRSSSTNHFLNTAKLSACEKEQLTSATPSQERISRFFWMWTVKEAYTKALGLGLGFDFCRVEFDALKKRVRVDGVEPYGWVFTLFVVHEHEGEGVYQGVVAEFVGERVLEIRDFRAEPDCSSWLRIRGAREVMQRALVELPCIKPGDL